MNDNIQTIPLAQLTDSPFQGRFPEVNAAGETSGVSREMEELARSIGSSGLLQAIIVRPKDGGFEVIDGHRRVEAFKYLGLQEIQALVREADDREAQIISVVSNLQRKNLKLFELAVAYKKMLDTGLFTDNKKLSEALGKDETYVGDVLSTLNMDVRILDDLAKNDSMRDLRMLRMIRKSANPNRKGVSDKQWELYNQVITEKLNRKQLAELLRPKKKSSATSSWIIKQNQLNLTVRYNTKNLNDEQKNLLQQFIEEKLAEFRA